MPAASATPPEPKKTVLNAEHHRLGAVITIFGEWEMPLWYPAGAVKEHLAVVTAAGLFDTSHMDVLFITGAGALKLLDRAFSRDLAALKPNRGVYGVFLADNGNCLDDGVLYPLGPDRFAVVVNAGMGRVVARHLESLPEAAGVAVGEPAERLAKLDVQGPAAPKIVENLLADPGLLASFPYFSFKGDFDLGRSDVFLKDGTPALLSRSGYTGEVGFEIFVPLAGAKTAWDAILANGEAHDILPCGLAARDTLRAGAMLPLSHQDIGAWPFINNPWTFALPLTPDGVFGKDFVGAKSLNPAAADHTLAFAGFDQRRIDSHSATVIHRGEEIGAVLTIVSDMAIGRVEGEIVSLTSPDKPADWKPRGLSCGFVKVTRSLEPGELVKLRDQRREIEVAIVSDIRPNRTARRKLETFL